MAPIDETAAVNDLIGIAERLQLSDIRIAGATGLASSTVYLIRTLRRLPKRDFPRRSVLNFIAANKGARSISELRFVTAA